MTFRPLYSAFLSPDEQSPQAPQRRSSEPGVRVVGLFEPLAAPQIDRLPGWKRLAGAIDAGRAPEVLRLQWRGASPTTMRVAIGRPQVRVRSFWFGQSSTGQMSNRPPAASVSSAPAQQTACNRPAARNMSAARNGRLSRIRPPGDVIKLSERLQYVLQPPVELLLADRSLALPAEPFAFQFEGIAFLYPRQSAILADEMGLGKTMQAITAIRLLLRRGEVRSVLLVCPKPLVPSWQREFERWAPELGVMVVSGPPGQRAWQWRLKDVAVRIANYELLCRDEDVLLGRDAGGCGGQGAPSPESQTRRSGRDGRHSPAGSAIDEQLSLENASDGPGRWKTGRRTWWGFSNSSVPGCCGPT